jgi:hypothetical protein
VLTIGPDVYADIEDVTLQGARDTSGLGGPGSGGAIANDHGGTVAISGSTFSGNIADHGGAIDNGGSGGIGFLSVSGSTFSGNSAGDGGAVDNGDAGVGNLSVTGCIFSGNSADGDGGAIDNADNGGSGLLSVSGSTFSGNTPDGDGGAIDNGDRMGNGSLNVTSSTFWGNHSGSADGGAIDNGDGGGKGTLTASTSTFSGNAAANGAVIYGGGSVWTAADIFDGSCVGTMGGQWHDAGYNLAAGASCLDYGPGDSDYKGSLYASVLAAPAGNGGPTETMMPLSGDPAIGLVPNPTSVTLNGSSVQLCPTTDQRGDASASGRPCDAGAVQTAGTSSGGTTTTGNTTASGPTGVALPTTTTSAAPARTVRPHVGPVISAMTATAAVSKGRVRLKLHCADALCRGADTLMSGHVRFGAEAYHMEAGATSMVTVKLSAEAMKSLAHAKRHTLKVAQVVAVAGGKTVKEPLTLVG